MIKLRFAACVTLALAISGCGASSAALPKPPGTGDGGRLEIVATAYPLFEAASVVGGKRARVHNLLPKSALDGAPLTADQQEKLSEADLAVVLGRQTQPTVEAVTTQRTKPTVGILETVGRQDQVVDPFLWLDPANQGRIAEEVERQLVAIDPAGAETYRENREGYDRAIAGVDRQFARRLSACERKDVLTTVPAYSYMTERYGLRQVAVAETALAGTPSIADAVKQYNAKAVYFAALPGLDDARELRAGTGARASTLDPLANQSDQARRGGASYGMVMKLNLDAITEGLGCIPPRE